MVRPDFLGLGAQRASTSWVYACLYEHPQVCMPRKEVHFFSRERNWRLGYSWYEGLFDGCSHSTMVGEISTSYLTHVEAPMRIRDRYPEVKLFAVLRNPVDRAFSSYLNDMVAGVVAPTVGFENACTEHPEYVEDGRYASSLQRYLEQFSERQLLVLLFDDARRDPRRFIQDLCGFIGVDPSFEPSMLHRRVGKGRVPRWATFDQWLVKASSFLRTRGLERVWWLGKRAGLGDILRRANTRPLAAAARAPSREERTALLRRFEPEIAELEELLGRDLTDWRR